VKFPVIPVSVPLRKQSFTAAKGRERKKETFTGWLVGFSTERENTTAGVAEAAMSPGTSVLKA